MKKLIPDQGSCYNSWIVINYDTQKAKDGHTMWYVHCLDCDVTNSWILAKDLIKGRSKRCKKCASRITAKNYPPPINSKAIGDLSGTFYWHIKNNALRRNLSFEIDQEFLWSLYLKQKGKCALSGLDIKLSKDIKNSSPDYSKITASVDRINNDEGYTIKNVQWVHKDVNFMKQEYDQSYFITICKQISKTAGKP